MAKLQLCPFHPDKSPSLAVYEETDSFYCFSSSCHAHGPLSQLAGLKKGKKLPRVKKAKKVKFEPEEVLQKYEGFLNERELTTDDIRSFKGYCDIPTGYVWLPTEGGKIGRYLFNETEDSPRYLIDGVPLFGDTRAEKLFLTEGPFDALQMIKAGLPAVSAGGSNASPEALYKLKDKTLYILFDDDLAGWEGARKVAEKLDTFRGRYQILNMTQAKDPQEALLKCPEKFKKWLNKEFKTQTEREWLGNELREKLTYIPTGIKPLDDKIKGLAPSSFVGITGKPSAGKSAVAIAIARNIAKNGKKVGYCTYEISKRQIYCRLLSPAIGRTWEELEESGIPEAELIELGGVDFLENIEVKVSPSLGEILMLADTSDVVVIDYAQCVPIRNKDLHRGFKEFTESLIELAVKRNKIIILLSAMARSAYDNSNTMAAFKEFGDLEYRFALALRIFKIGQEREAILKVKVLKNTRGKMGKVNIPFDYGINEEIEEVWD